MVLFRVSRFLRATHFLAVSVGRIKKFFSDLRDIARHGDNGL
jgi:hypothetical protein